MCFGVLCVVVDVVVVVVVVTRLNVGASVMGSISRRLSFCFTSDTSPGASALLLPVLM